MKLNSWKFQIRPTEWAELLIAVDIWTQKLLSFVLIKIAYRKLDYQVHLENYLR